MPTIHAICATPRAQGKRETLLDRVGWLHPDCLRPGGGAHRPEILEQARAHGRRCAEDA